MPVPWRVFHSTREVVDGAVCLKEMEECVEGIMTPATRSYRKFVDLAKGHFALGRDQSRVVPSAPQPMFATGI